MSDNVLKSFIKDTYKTTSIVPYFITGQVVMFILLHIFDLLAFSGTTSVNLYNLLLQKSVLSINFQDFIYQPWSIITHPFVYSSLWNLLFDCLWLYWTGNLFLNFLSTRQFNTVFLGGIGLGAVLFLLIGLIPYFQTQNTFWHSSAFGLAAILSSLVVLVPNTELRLILLGNIKFKWIAAVHLGLEFAFLVTTNKSAALAYILVIFLGMIFMRQLQEGKDLSTIFKKKNKKLKIVKNNTTEYHSKLDQQFPNQQQIDQILDKISLKGYESLTSQEKELLFRASKKQD